MFNAKRDAITDLYRTFLHYQEPDQAEDALEFLEGFWEVIDDPRNFQRRIVADCTEMPR
jgi:hypothetical protein